MANSQKQRRSKKPVPSLRRVGRLWGWVIGTMALVSFGLWLFKTARNVPAPPAVSGFASRIQTAGSLLEEEKTVLATYVGSAACQACHKEAYDAWTASNHGLAERALRRELDQGAFDPPRTFRHGTQQASTTWQEEKARITASGLSGQAEGHQVERVIGHDPLRQFLVTAEGGRLQALETAYDPRKNDWFNVYGDEDRHPGEWGHWTGRGMNWNSMCASCHNTRLRKNYDSATDTYRTTMAEKSVGCEACHGPLRDHVDWQAKYGKSVRRDPTLAKLNPTQRLDSCGFCHARRVDLTGDFKPGDSFLDHEELVLADQSDRFYPDGQVRDENYEYASFLSSRMHGRGVTCLDCHNPHSAKPILPGNWLCMRCHNGNFTNAPVIAPMAHSHHQVFGYSAEGVATNLDLMSYRPSEIKQTGGECVNCHMPQTNYMQRHWRHDHSFTIPDPLLTKELGIPNACNRCHPAKETDWALHSVDQWYGPKMDRPSRLRARWIAQARNGDPSARLGLSQLLEMEANPYWRAVAADLLGTWAVEAPILSGLLQHLQDSNALVRAACVRALEPIAVAGSPRVVRALQERLEDPMRNVRVAAAWALRSDLAPEVRAARELRHALELSADQPGGQMQQGIYLFSRNEPSAALTCLEKAVAWDPGSAPFRQELAVLLSALQRPEEALEQLKAACRLAPQDAETHFKLGLAYDQLDNRVAATAELKEAVRLDPRHARAWYNLGLAEDAAGDPTTAVESLLRAESIEAGDSRIPYARATILARHARPEEARAAIRRALELRPDFSEARQLLERLTR